MGVPDAASRVVCTRLSHDELGGLMDRSRVSRSEAAFIVGVPLAWAFLPFFHPKGEGDRIYADLQDLVTAALVVQPLPFVVFFSAWETLQGTPHGILASGLNAVFVLWRSGSAAVAPAQRDPHALVIDRRREIVAERSRGHRAGAV